MGAERAIASGKRRLSVVIAAVILTIGAAWPDAADESSGSVEVGVPFIDDSRSVWDLTSGTIAVLPTGNVDIWKQGNRLRKSEPVPERTWFRTRDNVTSEVQRALGQYGCSIIRASECIRRVGLAMLPENRPNELADLVAGTPTILVSIIPKIERDLPTETDWQRIFYKEHRTAVRSVGKYLKAAYLVSACVTRDEQRGRLLAYFQIYDVASAKVILHVVGAGSYAQPTEGSTPERDAVRSGLAVGLEKLGLRPREHSETGRVSVNKSAPARVVMAAPQITYGSSQRRYASSPTDVAGAAAMLAKKQATSCGCGCGTTTATATAVKPQPRAAAITKPAASVKVTSGTVAGSCCTTGCVTTVVAGK